MTNLPVVNAICEIDRVGANVVAATQFDPRRRVDMVAPWGSSVAEIVEFVLPSIPPETARQYVRVFINGELVPVARWSRTRLTPKNGDTPTVVVRIVAGNSGALRAGLSIAVGVAALALGQVWAAPLAAAIGFGGSAVATSVASGLISATTLLVGTFLINALIPPRRDQSKTGTLDSPTYAIQGFRNSTNPDGVIPSVYGKVRFAPPYAALPYTEAINGENYVYALFVVGYGPVEIRDIRLGDTPIDKYKEVEYQVRNGYSSDLPQTIYPKQVLEERLTVDLNKAYSDHFGAHPRFTATDADEFAIEIAFPSGLFWMHTTVVSSTTTTQPLPFAVAFRISYRLNGVGAFTTVDWTITDLVQKTRTYNYKIRPPGRGRYEVKVERLTQDFDDFNSWLQYDQFVSVSIWTALRSYRPEYPLNFNKPLAVIAVKARGSKQLNGAIDNLNCEASRICKDWNGAAWVDAETQNPASLYRYALQGPHCAFPRADAEIDLVALQNWHDFCGAKGLTYNRVHDFEASVFDVAEDVCAAGRGSARDDGEKWGVVVNQRQTITRAHITPRNAWDISGERPYLRIPDGFTVKFYDETNFYKPAERVIPWPGFVGDPIKLESIDLPGVTNPDLIWIEARRLQYETIYRRDVYYASQDYEGAIAQRGDLVRFNYDVLKKTQIAGRVKAVSGNAVTLDEWVTMQDAVSYGLRIRKMATVDGADDLSILRTIQTTAGQTNTIILTGAGMAPEPGDLFMFGVSGQESIECLVTKRESTNDLGARLTLTPYAANVFDLVDAEIPPLWLGRVGEVSGPYIQWRAGDVLAWGAERLSWGQTSEPGIKWGPNGGLLWNSGEIFWGNA